MDVQIDITEEENEPSSLADENPVVDAAYQTYTQEEEAKVRDSETEEWNSEEQNHDGLI